MKKTTAMLLTLLVAGCFMDPVTPAAYEASASACRGFDGLKKILDHTTYTTSGELKLICRDGTMIFMTYSK